MDTQEVLNRLSSATRGDREIDYMIAEVMGWKKNVQTSRDKDGKIKERTLWLVPSGRDMQTVPTYTSNLQDAYRLARDVRPDSVGGCSWELGKGTAVIDDGPYFQAATPILALCMAAMYIKHSEP